MALARLPVMPLSTKMMEMRCQPASFSRSLRMVIWKITDTRQCTTLAETRWQPFYLNPHCPAHWGHVRGAGGHLPRMEEQRQPEAVELVGDLRVEEG